MQRFRFAWAWTVGVVLAVAPAAAQTPIIEVVSGGTTLRGEIADFPPCLAGKPRLIYALDGASATDCTVGGGALEVLCSCEDAGYAAVGAGATALDDLTDVETAGAALGEALAYDGDSWTPTAAAAILEGDARLSNSRTPLPHATSHNTGGTDLIAYVPSGERVRVLDSDGAGHYSTLAAALADLATEPRTPDSLWHLIVMPGSYSEPTGLVVPKWVNVSCFGDVPALSDSPFGDNTGCQISASDGTSDCFIGLGDSSLVGLQLFQLGSWNTSGAVVCWEAGGYVELRDVTIHATVANTTGVRMDSTLGDRLSIFGTGIHLEGFTSTVGVDFSSSGEGRIVASEIRTAGNGGTVGVRNTGSGTLRALATFVEAGAFGWTTRYLNTGGGTLSAADRAASTSDGGPATTATALAANGANCAAGEWAAGVSAAGAAEGCTADDDVPEAGDFGALALTGDVSSSGLATTIGADKILESMLKAVDAPADEEFLTYESTTGDFEWQAGAGGVTDHGALTGLGDDDHAQYALLAGRSSGQSLAGGTAAGEDLTLRGTTHGTAGDILVPAGQVLVQAGAAATPGIGVNGDSNTGILWNCAGQAGEVCFVKDGVVIGFSRDSPAGLQWTGAAIFNSFVGNGDSDTGWVMDTGDQMRALAGNVAKITVTTTAVTNAVKTTIAGMTHHGSLGTAPAACTVGDLYSDTSAALCFCSATNTWSMVFPFVPTTENCT